MGLIQNQEQLLGGLWGFVQAQHYTPQESDTLLGSFTHHYSHFALEASVLLIHQKEEMPYFSIQEIHQLPLSGADRKALALLEQYLT